MKIPKSYLKIARNLEAKRGKISVAEFERECARLAIWIMTSRPNLAALKCRAVAKAMKESKAADEAVFRRTVRNFLKAIPKPMRNQRVTITFRGCKIGKKFAP